MIIFIVKSKELLNLQNEDNDRAILSSEWDNASKHLNTVAGTLKYYKNNVTCARPKIRCFYTEWGVQMENEVTVGFTFSQDCATITTKL